MDLVWEIKESNRHVDARWGEGRKEEEKAELFAFLCSREGLCIVAK